MSNILPEYLISKILMYNSHKTADIIKRAVKSYQDTYYHFIEDNIPSFYFHVFMNTRIYGNKELFNSYCSYCYRKIGYYKQIFRRTINPIPKYSLISPEPNTYLVCEYCIGYYS